MANFPEHFEQQYQLHLKHLKLKGMRPKTIDAYARGMRRIGEYFSYRVDDLSEDDLVEYFTDLMESHSWSGVKLDLYGLKFFTEHVLHNQAARIDDMIMHITSREGAADLLRVAASSNMSLGTDTPQQEAASRLVWRTGQLRR